MTETDDDGPLAETDARRRFVRDRYAGIARDASERGSESCCDDSKTAAESLGYSDADVAAAAEGADLGLGCGNPKAIAGMESGETVLDLGSGAGFDCFLAAREVGESGQVIGVDMTPEMIERARENARTNDAGTVEFRLGEIEHLPVADASVDVVISNCVINLSPEKPQVFAEAYRALVPGGRLAVSDVVKTAPFPEDVRADPDSLAACVTGATTVEALEGMLADAGFVDVEIAPKADSAEFISEWDDERDLSEYIVSATIEARKPA
jgi:arsenite methyltransferase